MESRTGEANAAAADPINLKRLFWLGPLTVVSSALAVFLIRTIAVAILKAAASFLPLSMETPLSDTVALSAAAVFVFLAKCRYALEPVREYRALALKALAVSLLPDVALAMLHWFGGGWPEALALMAMHVAVWAHLRNDVARPYGDEEPPAVKCLSSPCRNMSRDCTDSVFGTVFNVSPVTPF